jgi:hypothetical protein
MKNIIYFILGIVCTISIAATTGRELFLLEPVTPSETLVLTAITGYQNGGINHGPDIYGKAIPYIKQGFIVKTVTIGGDHYGLCAIMVLEKY